MTTVKSNLSNITTFKFVFLLENSDANKSHLDSAAIKIVTFALMWVELEVNAP
jgi:hypothetical protein